MSMAFRSDILLPDPDATTRFAHQLSARLGPGQALLLEGPVGAGKTAFCRALIQACLGAQEDVPSPTFTLVQTYEAPEFDIWHCDLYRLTSPDEVIELGLDEAFETALCLIEWPDRLGDLAPSTATTLHFEVVSETARRVALSGTAPWVEEIAA